MRPAMFLPSPDLTSEARFECASPRVAPTVRIQLSEVLLALSHALDLTEGQPEGHALRTCAIGMRIADEIGLPGDLRAALYYTLLLKDLGSPNTTAQIARQLGVADMAASPNLRLSEWPALPGLASWGGERPTAKQTIVEQALNIVRGGMGSGPLPATPLLAEGGLLLGQPPGLARGARIAQLIGLPDAAVQAIGALDARWDGMGHPASMVGEQIPIIARIASLAQTFDILRTAYGHEHAYAVARQRCGTWFDPQLVRALERFACDLAFWRRLAQPCGDISAIVEPLPHALDATPEQIDQLAEGFAQVIDARSPWTYRHSTRVAAIAERVAVAMGVSPEDRVTLRRAALLHDIGKLGIPNSILNKPGKLDEHEFAVVRMHPIHTQRILEHVGAFHTMAAIAAAHHERLDGSGYPYHLRADEIPQLTHILSVADVAEALSVERPYRRALDPGALLGLLRREAGVRLCADAVDAFASVLAA
ncbi:HD domain-containing protein [Chloroflexia bacterium SDU3-3]|nr:HD domain-containing protein [Chloroflexia bacterium SDU3-3]